MIDNNSSLPTAKKVITLPPNRVRAIPKFNLDDITGTFTSVILRGGRDGQNLFDKAGRRVNRRGYLIDVSGSIIT